MKHLKAYNDYIFESVQSPDVIYKKYYTDVPKHVFREIVDSDPTTKPNKLGVYCKWILNIYRAENLKIEDLYKVTEYLKLYHRFKYKLPIHERNIDNIKSLPDLAMIIEPFETPIPELLSKSENKESAFVKSFENYDLYIPKTYEESRDLGRGTQWCTAADSEDGRKLFDFYTKKDVLYILISKQDPKLKYQLHFKDMQFKDRFDGSINMSILMDSNLDIKNYFEKRINKILENIDLALLEVKKSSKYPRVIFYVKDLETLIVFYIDSKILVINYDKLYSPLRYYFNYSYSQITDMLAEKLEKVFKINLEGVNIDSRPESQMLSFYSNRNHKSYLKSK